MSAAPRLSGQIAVDRDAFCDAVLDDIGKPGETPTLERAPMDACPQADQMARMAREGKRQRTNRKLETETGYRSVL